MLYTVMFWEAPEKVIDHFLEQVPRDFEVDCEFVWRLLLLTKYSIDFYKRLIRRCEGLSMCMLIETGELRPALAVELGL